MVQKYLRMFQVLSWIGALNEGFKREISGGSTLPATVSNIAGVMINEDVMTECYAEADDSFTQLKNHLNMLLTKYRLNGFVRRPEKVKQTKANHYALQSGLASRGKVVYRYALSESGESAKAWCRDRFDQQNEYAKEHGVQAQESIKLPRQRGLRWKLNTFSVAKVETDILELRT